MTEELGSPRTRVTWRETVGTRVRGHVTCPLTCASSASLHLVLLERQMLLEVFFFFFFVLPSSSVWFRLFFTCSLSDRPPAQGRGLWEFFSQGCCCWTSLFTWLHRETVVLRDGGRAGGGGGGGVRGGEGRQPALVSTSSFTCDANGHEPPFDPPLENCVVR